MTIQETQQQIQQRQTEISQAKEQLQKAQQSIPETSQRQLRGQVGGQGLAGRQFQRQLAGAREEVSRQKEYVGEVEKSVKEYEKQLGDYLQTSEGKLQFAKESGIKGQPIYDRVIKGGTIELVGYKYSTPYGEVTDYSPREKLLYQQAKSDIYDFERNAAVAKAAGITSEKSLLSSGIDINKSLSTGILQLPTQDISKSISVDKTPIIQILPSAQQFTRGSTDLATGMQTGGQNGLNQFRNLVTGMASSGIPLVSASSDKDLNTSIISKVNGNTNVSSGGNVLVRGIQQLRDSVSNIIGSRSDFDKAREIYIPKESGFVKAEQALSGRTETAIIRPPTLIEQSAITSASLRGGGEYRGSPLAIPAIALERGTELLGRKIESLYPEQTQIKYNVPIMSGTLQYQFNPQTNKLEPITSIQKTGTLTREQMAEPYKFIAQTGVMGLAFATPYVGNILAASYGAKGLQQLQQPEIKTLSYSEGEKQGYTREQVDEYNSQVEQLNKQNKLGAYMDIGMAALPVAAKISGSAIRGTENILKVGREAKYLSPEGQVFKSVSLETRPVENILTSSTERPKLDILATPEERLGGIKVVKKGETIQRDIFKSQDLVGNVKEVRDVGNIKFDFVKGNSLWDSKISIGRSFKTLEGTAVRDISGNYKEIINLPNDLKKITEMDASGKGVIKIVDKEGKILNEQKINYNPLGDLTEKTSIEKLKVDTATNKKQLVTKTEVIGKSGKEVIYTDAFGNRIINLQGTEPSLQSKKIVAEFETKNIFGQNIKTGGFAGSSDITGFTDIIKSGQRKGEVVISKGEEGAKLRRQTQQEIVYGIDKDKDIKLTLKQADEQASIKKISPKVERQLTSIEGQKFTFGYVNPKYSKNLQAMQLAEQQRIAANKWLSAKSEEISKAIQKNEEIQKQWEQLGKGIEKSKQSTNPLLLEDLPKPSKETYQIQSYLGGGESKEPTQNLYEFVKNAPNIGIENIAKESQVFVPSPLSLLPEKTPSLKVDLAIVPQRVEQGIKNLFEIKTLPLTKLDVKTQSQLLTFKEQQLVQPKNEIQVKTMQNIINDIKSKEEVQTQQKMEQLQELKLKQELKQEQQKQQREETTNKVGKEVFRLEPSRPLKPIVFEKKSARDTLKAIAKEEGFEVFKKVKGKLISIGEEETAYLAGRKLKRSLLSDISASGIVVKKGTGEKVKAQELGLDTSFRVGKRNPFLLVQREGTRLSSRGEILGIQAGKRNKSRKNLW